MRQMSNRPEGRSEIRSAFSFYGGYDPVKLADCYTQRDVRHGNRIGYDLFIWRPGTGNRHIQFHDYSTILSRTNTLTGCSPDQQLSSFLVGDIRSGAKRSDNNRDGCGVPGQHDLQLYDLRRDHRDTVIQCFHDLYDLFKRNHHIHREGNRLPWTDGNGQYQHLGCGIFRSGIFRD